MPGEGEDAADNDIESDGQQTVSAKRPQSTRTKDTPEILEADSAPSGIEKNKLTNNQRCSNRITKRSRRDPSPVDPTSKKPGMIFLRFC